MFKITRNCKLLLRLCEPQQCKTLKTAFNNISRNGYHPSINRISRCFGSSSPEVEQETVIDKNVMPDVKSITRGDAELEHKLKVIVLETEVMRQEGRNVPSNSYLATHHWEELLKLNTRTARRRYLDFLFKVQKKKQNATVKKQQKRIEREERPDDIVDDGHLRYDLGHNNIFLRFYDSTINNLYNSKLIEAMQFGQKLVIDCGFDKNMTTRENINCAKQLMLSFSDNRFHDDPYDLHYCNLNFKSELCKGLHRHIPIMYEPWFPLNLHESSYLDVFPKNQLVYLTPHCKETLTEYDHDAVYIIGGIVDKINNEPLSLAKAKREGLKMAKFPLDNYLQWGSGSGKTLTLNQVISILLDMKLTGDWKYALRHVPRRKIIDYSQQSKPEKFDTHKYDKELTYKKFRANNNEIKNFGRRSNNPRRIEIRNIMDD